MQPSPPNWPHHRGADNFPMGQRPRRRDEIPAELPALPPPRPLSRREQRNLSLGLTASLALAGLLLTTGAALLDFEGPRAAPSLADVPRHEVFIPVAATGTRNDGSGVYLRAAEPVGDGSPAAPLQPGTAGGLVHALNNPAPLPPPPPMPEPPPPAAPALPAPTAAATAAGGRALVPTTGWISTYFGRGHAGIDIAAPTGQPIAATAAGVVRAVYDWRVSYGRHLIVDHGSGWDSLYAHLTNVAVRPGQQVAAGQLLGWVGATGNATGPHLHFEVRYQGQTFDPLAFLPQ